MVYDYVKRRYRVDPKPGARVQDLYGTQQRGTIITPEHEDQYVHVLFDGFPHPFARDPLALDYDPEPAAGEIRVIDGKVCEYRPRSSRSGSWARIRPAVITHYGLHRAHVPRSPMIKTAEYFRAQGGLSEGWGKAWEPIYEAPTCGEARRRFAASKGFELSPIYFGEA